MYMAYISHGNPGSYLTHAMYVRMYACQPVLIASISDKKYRLDVPFEVLTNQVGLYVHNGFPLAKNLITDTTKSECILKYVFSYSSLPHTSMIMRITLCK